MFRVPRVKLDPMAARFSRFPYCCCAFVCTLASPFGQVRTRLQPLYNYAL